MTPQFCGLALLAPGEGEIHLSITEGVVSIHSITHTQEAVDLLVALLEFIEEQASHELSIEQQIRWLGKQDKPNAS